MATPDFQERELIHQQVGGAVVLDAVRLTQDTVQAFFAVGTKAEQITAGEGTKITLIRSVGEGMIVTAECSGDPVLAVDGVAAKVAAGAAETDLFKGQNVIFATRNGESAETALEWLAYHADSHDMQGALILDRCRPGEGADFAKAVKQGARKIKGLKTVVVVRADVPLGAPDLPPEEHPFNAPDAPGKDRMDIPEASPWDAPLGELQLFEWARRRFLETARAVALIDLCDLMGPKGGKGTVFDAAVGSSTGAITLGGRNC